MKRISELKKLLNAVAFVFRFVHRKKGGKAPDVEETKCAVQFLIQEDQQKFLTKEVGDLKTKGRVAKSSKIAALNPRMDKEGIL